MRRIILTASGGAFRDWPVERLKEVTACRRRQAPQLEVRGAFRMLRDPDKVPGLRLPPGAPDLKCASGVLVQ